MQKIDMDKAYSCAFSAMQENGMFASTELRTSKKQYNYSLVYKEFPSARNTTEGIEAMDMIFKGQIGGISYGNAYDIKIFIEGLFEVKGLAA